MHKILLISVISVVLMFTSCKQPDARQDGIQGTSGTEAPVHLTRAEFLNKVIDFEKNPAQPAYKGDKPCIVDFYASWCGPCKMVSPILEELAKEYAGQIYIYKVDTEKEQQLSGELGIRSIPTFLFCPVEGEVFGSSGTAGTPEQTKAMFKKIIEEKLLQKQATL